MSAYRPVEELHALLDAAVEGIVVIDHLGRIQAFNRSAERLFGYPAGEVLDRNVTVLMTEPDRIAHDGHLARYAATRVPHIIGNGREVSARRKDGSVFPAYLLVGAIAGSEPARFFGFVHDMTPRRQGEEQAHRLQERLWHVSRLATVGEMASGIAHELNQPLAAIANYAHACDRLLGRPDTDLEEVQGALKEIAAQAMRAGDIIRRLRSLAHPHVDRREPTEINVLITELTALVRSDAQAHELENRVRSSCALPGPATERLRYPCVTAAPGSPRASPRACSLHSGRPNPPARASALRSAVPSSQSTAVHWIIGRTFRSVPASPCAYRWRIAETRHESGITDRFH